MAQAHRWLVVRGIAMTVWLMAAGCQVASTDADTTVGCPPAQPVPELYALRIDADDDVFLPSCVLVLPEAATRLVIRNVGRHPHTFTIDEHDVDVHVDAGQVTFVDVDTSTGDVTYRCTIHDGMAGVLRSAPA